MIRSGLVSVTFRKLSPREIVDLCVRAKLEGIEWGGDVHVPHGAVATAREVRALTLGSGLAIPSYGSYYRCGEDPPSSPVFADVFETATALGTPSIRVWAGRQGSSEAGPLYRRRVADDARRIALMATDAGLSIAFEYHAGTLTDSPTSAVRLLEDVGEANVSLYWQPPNNTTTDEQVASLARVVPKLSNVHVFHWVFQAGKSDRMPLAQGAEAWRAFLQAVRSTGRDHWALLEFVKNDNPNQLLRDAQTLRRWLERQERP